jgi:hypothetical protein
MTERNERNGKTTDGGAFDLASFDILTRGGESQPLELIDPRSNTVIGADAGKPATLYVLSYESDTMVRWSDKQADKNQQRARPLSNEELREFLISRSAQTLMAREWEHIDWEGKPLAYNLSNAQLLMRRLAWAKKQVDALASNEAAYLAAKQSTESTEP